jgi:cytidylate kinase
MEIRAITIGGEYGSGRAEIAERVANRLGWRLVDNCLIEDIARTAHVDPEVARRFDERTDPWLHRLHKALWHGGYEGVVTTTEAGFDADAMAAAARLVIEQAAMQGHCVIVGRGAQCVLQQREEVFHVFVYAPREKRIERLRRREKPGTDVEALLDDWDRRRQNYARRYFGQEWTNHHLFDLMLCSAMGQQAAVAAILAAVGKYGS